MRDKRAKRLEVQYLYGARGRICSGYKREGESSYLGRSGNRSPADRLEIMWHRRETSRQTEKTKIELRRHGRQGAS